MTIRIDQLADAILNAPGVSIKILDTPNGSDSTTSATFVTCDAANTQKAFLAPLAGLYRFIFSADFFPASASATVVFRLVIDKDAPNQQVTPDDTTWAIQEGAFFGQRLYKTFLQDFELAAGTHTFEVQWRRLGGSGTLSVSSGGSMQCYAQLVSGSGAGGTIVATAVPTANPSQVVSSIAPTYTDITGMSVTVNTFADERLTVDVLVDINCSGGTGTPLVGIFIDGVLASRYFETGSTGYELCASWSYVTDPMSAGTHTIKVAAAKQGADPNYTVYGTGSGAAGYLRVTQHRGGLVPIRQDGVDKVGQPRALDFIGAGVYQVTEGTGADAGVARIELNPAVTAVGSSQTQLDNSVTGNTSAGTPLKIFDKTFITSEGLHQIRLNLSGWSQWSASRTVNFTLIIDEGTGDAQSFGGVGVWQLSLNTGSVYVLCPTFDTQATLSEGSHSVRVYAQNSAAGGSYFEVLGASNPQQATLTLVTGSGASGTLLASATASGNPVNISGTLYADVAGLSTSITVSAGETVQFVVVGEAYNSTVAWNAFMQWVDGSGNVLIPHTYGFAANGAHSHTIPVNWSAFYTFPTAGTYTVKLQAKTDSGTWGFYDGKIYVLQYRGGLVPIRDNGAVVIDKPAAIDFVGDNVQVTNVGGTAKVAFNGVVKGVDTTKATLQANWTTPSVYSDWHDIDNGGGDKLEVTVDVVEGESVLFDVHILMLSLDSTTAGYTRLLVDGVAQDNSVSFDRAYTHPNYIDVSTNGVVSGLATGPHVFKVQGKSSNAAQRMQVITQDATFGDAQLAITKIKGGYVQPENVPILSYLNAGTVNIQAAPGASSNLRLLMNDGVRYQATSPLTVTLSTTGLGGLDTGTEAVSTWYYIYAVPSATTGYFSVVASVTPPTGGPTGYAAWRYLGAIYNNSSGNIRTFTQQGVWFFARDPSDAALSLYSSDGQPTQNTWVSCTAALSVAVPTVVAGTIQVQAYLDSDGGQSPKFWLEPGNPPTFTPSVVTGPISSTIVAGQDNGQQVNSALRQLFDGTMSWYYIESASTANLNVSMRATAWQDKYLSELVSQLQAIYQPDTALPQLTWVGNSSVTVAAAPGQSSAVRSTLQDGVQRSFTGTLTWDPSIGIVDGGLDTGAEAVSTWYYLYLVPRFGADTMLTVRGSVNSPLVGPVGYANWRYIGAVRNDASSNILDFKQVGSSFEYATNTQPVPFSGGGSADVSLQTLALANHVPATALQAHLGAYIQVSSPGALYFFVDGKADLTSSTTRWNTSHARIGGNATNEVDHMNAMVPTPGATKQVGYFRETAYAEFRIDCFGWVDGYLGSAVTGTTIQGARGTLVTSAQRTTDYSSTSILPTWISIPGLSATITAAQGEQVLMSFTGVISSSATNNDVFIAFAIDGVRVDTAPFESGTYHRNMSTSRMSPPLAAGSHTVAVWMGQGLAGTLSCYASAYSQNSYARLDVTQFRGGLVPVQKDGVEVINTPTAYNFTGDNVQITGAGGKANIAFNGVAEGTETTNRVFATSVTTTSGSWTVVNDGSEVSVTVTTVANERVYWTGKLDIYCSVSWAQGEIGIGIDGADPTEYAICGQGGVYPPASVVIPSTLLTAAGAHTLRLLWRRTSGSGTLTLAGGNILQATQYRGGFVQPENIPTLEYRSTSQVRVKAGPGAASTLWLLLNDGARYQATSPLTVDLTVSGIGGIDTGSEAVSTWYYVYAVPSTTSGRFSVLCSVTPPPTGPTGYSVWRYLGAMRNDGSGNIVEFTQTGNSFSYVERQEAASSVALGTTLQTVKVALSMADVVPATSNAMLVGMEARHGVTAGGDVYFQLFVDTETNPVIQVFDQNGYGWASYYPSATVPMPTVPKQVGYRSYIGFGSPTIGPQHIYTHGWVDGYLSGLESQLQAEYQPDTLQPQILWRGVSRVDVQAQPGQPSTVLLTLQDGKQRSMTGYITWNPSLGAVDGGLDTGTEASSTWYYLYMVPKSGADDFLHVRGSVSAPPTGPTGYLNWRYIGAVRNNTISDLVRFWQNGTSFDTGTIQVESIDDPSGSAITAVDLSTHVPISALAAKTSWKAYSTSGYEIVRLFVDGYASSADQRYHEGWVSGGSDENVGQVVVPTPTVPKRIFRQIDEASGPGNARYWVLSVDGWFDGYLGSAAGFGGGGPIGNTLNGAYNQGGSGAGRVITANAGAVEINASGSNALKLDGYLTLQEIATPTALANKGLAYSQDDGGDTELFYRDDKGRSTQATKDGYLYAQSLQTRFVSAAAPTDGYGLLWDAANSKWRSGRPTPAPHAVSHKSGGYDSIKLDELAAPTDVTTLNSTVAAHGLLPKLSGSPGDALRGDGTWGVVSSDGYNVKVSGTDTTPDYLQQKLVAGNNIELTRNNPGGNETLTVATSQVLKLDEQVSDPTAHIDDGYLYAKDVAGVTELFYLNSSGNVVQATMDGYLHVTHLQDDQLPTKIADGFLKRKADNTGWEEVTYGSAANTVCEGDDSRLSDSRAPTGSASGDLSGTYPAPTVAAIRGRAFSEAVPLDGYVAVWNAAGGKWSPQIQDGYMLQRRRVSSAVPMDKDALVWNDSLEQWEPGESTDGYSGTVAVSPTISFVILNGVITNVLVS